MSNDRSLATIVLVDSEDVCESLGKRGYLPDHLSPMGASHLTVEVIHISRARCDIIARRLHGGQARGVEPPAGLESWYDDMTDPLEIPYTTLVFAVSLADAVNADVFRDKASGTLVQPPSRYRDIWTDEAASWLAQHFEPDVPAPENVGRALTSIVRDLGPSGAELIVFNTSTFVPDENVYWFRQGEPDTVSVRAARMNFALDSLLKDLNITLVDVDRIAAEIGARDAVVGPAMYTQETFEVIAEEALAVILDLEGVSNVFASDVMQLGIPRYDRRTSTATLSRWHVAPGAEVAKGDALFDVRFGNITSKLDDHGRETDRAIDMSVVAGRGGIVGSITASQGDELAVGDRVGVITAHRETVWQDIDTAAWFPVGVKVRGRDDT